MVGQSIGHYKILEKLGAGGMGEVWRASHRLLARPAAIKLVRPETMGNDDETRRGALRRFEAEAQATAARPAVELGGETGLVLRGTQDQRRHHVQRIRQQHLTTQRDPNTRRREHQRHAKGNGRDGILDEAARLQRELEAEVEAPRRSAWQGASVLSGTGANENWHYVASGIDPEPDGDLEWRGTLYEGGPPSFPHPVELPTPAEAATAAETIGEPADSGARIIEVEELAERMVDLTIDSPAVGVQSVRLLLPAGFDPEADTEMRAQALYSLSHTGRDDEVADIAVDIMRTETDREMLEMALMTLGQLEGDVPDQVFQELVANPEADDELRAHALWMASRRSVLDVDFLMKVYEEAEGQLGLVKALLDELGG